MKYNVEEITHDGEGRIIIINFNGNISDINEQNLINEISKQIFNDPKLKKDFFIADLNHNYIKILKHVSETSIDNEYINLINYDYIDIGDFIDSDLDQLIPLIHEKFISACIEIEDFKNNIDNKNNKIYI